MRVSGRIDIEARAIDALHHGAGTSGNTSLLRTQEVITPDGNRANVPFVSGNSFKHLLRASGVRFALQAMGVKDGSLTKPTIDLLFSGGALTKTGAAVDMVQARRLERLFPILSLCGYAAGNRMEAAKIKVDNIHLACLENSWRMPSDIATHPPSLLRAGALRSSEFGTRHESTRQPEVSRMLTDGEQRRLAEHAAEGMTKAHADKGDSAQMIYDFQVIKPGAIFWGAIHLDEVTQGELQALRSALEYACEGVGPEGGYLYRLGAKGSVGNGRVVMRFYGLLKDQPLAPPEYTESLAVLGESGKADLDSYVKHLQDNREEILSALEDAVK